MIGENVDAKEWGRVLWTTMLLVWHGLHNHELQCLLLPTQNLHKIMPVQNSNMNLEIPTPKWGIIGSWRLLLNKKPLLFFLFSVGGHW